ncbi:hypothetical protein THMIRHAM_12080 [Thiomicrorhabdus immobilis]|uniref:Cytochrome c domain-containing protein n=1 Tax=Thiomicrorhabdus immobilis TaxID=2791037 RepID=A0ABN6CWV6_9GAMM|nr:hypothetical protein [Thiomicrorhabdus immobilis]BCN93423.1 hypothetical protein THMIRHAM_12080 [Thiomicrorhabdus immobilis]
MKNVNSISNKSALKLQVIGSLSIALFSSNSFAEEPHPGKVLLDAANCMKCHSSKPYNPQKTTSYPKLVAAVSFCNENLNTGMFEDEVEQVADYLNQTYYHHPKD